MKYFYTLAALVALVSAQQLPECAVSCIRDATESETDCTFGDLACTCIASNRRLVTAAATPCVIAECGIEVATGQVLPATEALCANPPPASGTTTTAAAPPASSAAAPPASSAAAPPASSAAAPPAASSAAGGDDYPAPSAVPSDDGEDYPAPSAAPSHTPSGNGTVTPPAEPTHVEAGAAKAGVMGAAALVGLVALAL